MGISSLSLHSQPGVMVDAIPQQLPTAPVEPYGKALKFSSPGGLYTIHHKKNLCKLSQPRDTQGHRHIGLLA